MYRAGKQHPVETIVEWAAPIPLAVAAGWAGRALGLSLVEATALSVALLTAGFAAIRVTGSSSGTRPFGFEPAPFEAHEADPGELLLEASDELLELTDPLLELTDPLLEPDPDSRVVRLFERQEPTPGELVDRIVHFLEGGAVPSDGQAERHEASNKVDASDALHAALANIRASLR